MCKPGRFSDKPNNTACDECPVGRFSNQFGSSLCGTCEPGTQANATGLSLCSICPRNTYRTENMTLCTDCALQIENATLVDQVDRLCFETLFYLNKTSQVSCNGFVSSGEVAERFNSERASVSSVFLFGVVAFFVFLTTVVVAVGHIQNNNLVRKNQFDGGDSIFSSVA